MVAKLILRTFVGGEARLTWQGLPSPGRVTKPVSGELTTVVTKVCKLGQKKSSVSNLVNGFDSEEPRLEGVSGFGLLPKPTVFGLNARRQVKRLSAVLDGLASKPSDVIFFTGTLPGSTGDAMLALSQWSGFVVHRLKAWLHDQDGRYKCLFCWEWQKRGALHLHMAVYIDDEKLRRKVYDGFKQKWIDLLEDVCSRSGIDIFRRAGGRGSWRGHFDRIRARAEWVTKGVGAYLGKYLSKAITPGGESSKLFFPSRWWGSTQNLKDLEKAARTVDEHFYSSTGHAEAAYNNIVPFVGLLSEWSTEYRHKIQPGTTCVGASASVPLLRKLFYKGQKMSEFANNTKLKDCLAEFQALCFQLMQEDTDWFAGFCADYSVAAKYMAFCGGHEFEITESVEAELVLVMATSHMLSHSASSDVRYRKQRLHPRELFSIRDTCRRLKVAIDIYFDSRFLHTLTDIHYPGRKA